MAPQNFIKNDMASFPRLLEENLSMYEGTVLHLATQLGYEVDAKKIIEQFPFLVSSTNSKGDTPLHFAAILGHTNILIWMLESMKLHNACETKTLDDSKLAQMMNKDGFSPLHCAAMKGKVEILREFLDKAPLSFDSLTLGKNETVFHIAARHKKNKAFIFMAKSAKLGQLLYQLDAEGNTVLHVAASVGSFALVKYIIEETKIEVNTKNKKGFAAFNLLDNHDENFPELSTVLMCDPIILVEDPSSPREMVSFKVPVDNILKLQKEMIRVQSNDSPKKEFEMQLEALQSARNTLTIVGVLIASVTFTCGINPPGGLYQELGNSLGKSTAARTLAFMIFSISNTIALFTSLCMVILLLTIIPFREASLLKFLVRAHWMMWVAVSAMGSAYISAVLVTLPHCGETIWLLCATIAIAILTLGGMFVYQRVKLDKCTLRTIKFVKCLSSQPVRKNGSIEMAANLTKGYYCYN